MRRSRFPILLVLLVVAGALVGTAGTAAGCPDCGCWDEIVVIGMDGMFEGLVVPGQRVCTDHANDGAHPIEVCVTLFGPEPTQLVINAGPQDDDVVSCREITVGIADLPPLPGPTEDHHTIEVHLNPDQVEELILAGHHADIEEAIEQAAALRPLTVFGGDADVISMVMASILELPITMMPVVEAPTPPKRTNREPLRTPGGQPYLATQRNE